MSNLKEFTKGLIKENPNMVMLLGMCPTLAITTMAANGVGMGLSTTFVLVCSNIVISLLKKVIPDTVRLPAYIVIVAGFVTFVSLILQAFAPDVYSSLGMYLSLITVNCIILGRAEMFASKNKVIPSIMDGLGMGLGFTLTLVLVGSVREIFGSGQWFGITVMPEFIEPMTLFILPAGGFFVLGAVIAVVNRLMKKKPREIGCHNCPNAELRIIEIPRYLPLLRRFKEARQLNRHGCGGYLRNGLRKPCYLSYLLRNTCSARNRVYEYDSVYPCNRRIRSAC